MGVGDLVWLVFNCGWSGVMQPKETAFIYSLLDV